LSKIVESPIKKYTNNRAVIPFHTIFSDLKGPFKVPSHGGYRYMMSFIDDFSRYGYVYFLKSKDQSFSIFKQFHENEILARKVGN